MIERKLDPHVRLKRRLGVSSKQARAVYGVYSMGNSAKKKMGTTTRSRQRRRVSNSKVHTLLVRVHTNNQPVGGAVISSGPVGSTTTRLWLDGLARDIAANHHSIQPNQPSHPSGGQQQSCWATLRIAPYIRSPEIYALSRAKLQLSSSAS